MAHWASILYVQPEINDGIQDVICFSRVIYIVTLPLAETHCVEVMTTRSHFHRNLKRILFYSNFL